MQKLPVGVQGFEGLRNDGYLYVDKTKYIYQLIYTGKVYFLSRPRRFGKSLLLSTMKAYWEGKKELFRGLAIERLEQDNPDAWKNYPVFYFDFNGENYQDNTALEAALDTHLKQWEETYKLNGQEQSLGARFQNLLIAAREQTGLRSVILVDEYDKPLLEVLEDSEQEEHNKAVFKGFFSSLKKMDEYIQFIFITGVTKFEKVSIFSDLNQLRDISFNRQFSGICGITNEELNAYFTEEIQYLAECQELSCEQCREQLKKTYDGYHFHPQGEGVYNPFSLLNAFADGELGSYWFATGTPTFLVRRLKASSFDPRKFTDRTLYANESMLSDYRADNQDLVPLLYQTGYLTIVDYDRMAREYTLGFPNQEVQNGFLQSLMPEYVSNCGAGSGKDIFTLRRYVENGDLENIHAVLTALFASIPYTTNDAPFEHYFQTVIYLVFTLLGQFTQCEMHTWQGRIDCIVEAKAYVYLFEFKRDESAEAALKQIDDMGYALSYAADTRTIYKIGVNFDSEKRMPDDWKVGE